jgi:hypothetical protein
MEMFALNYSLEDNNHKDAHYTPVCSEEEIRKMIGIRHLRKQHHPR